MHLYTLQVSREPSENGLELLFCPHLHELCTTLPQKVSSVHGYHITEVCLPQECLHLLTVSYDFFTPYVAIAMRLCLGLQVSQELQTEEKPHQVSCEAADLGHSVHHHVRQPRSRKTATNNKPASKPPGLAKQPTAETKLDDPAARHTDAQHMPVGSAARHADTQHIPITQAGVQAAAGKAAPVEIAHSGAASAQYTGTSGVPREEFLNSAATTNMGMATGTDRRSDNQSAALKGMPLAGGNAAEALPLYAVADIVNAANRPNTATTCSAQSAPPAAVAADERHVPAALAGRHAAERFTAAAAADRKHPAAAADRHATAAAVDKCPSTATAEKPATAAAADRPRSAAAAEKQFSVTTFEGHVPVKQTSATKQLYSAA